MAEGSDMEVKCVIQFTGAPDDATPEAKAFFKERGWREAEGSFMFALEAALGGVDGPILELHKKIRTLYPPRGPLGKAVPVTVQVTAGGRVMFCAPAQFGFSGGKWGIRVSETDPPHFDDVLRLRDKTIATLVAISGGQ